jgi:DNA repair protein RecO (recombination protein O)
MLVKTKAIVISSVKYQEKSLIVKCFTQSSGLKSYFVPNVFASKKVNQKIAYFQPLSLLEVEAIHKNRGVLDSFKEIKIANPYFSIHTDIYKNTIALFISEVLNNILHVEGQNELLYNFLETAMQYLDNQKNISNFHLIFLLEMTKYLGFYPNTSEIDFPFFDSKEGSFVSFQSVTSLPEIETILFKKLVDLKFENIKNNFNVIERQLLLKILVDYYQFHVEGFKNPKSIAVLKEVFS